MGGQVQSINSTSVSSAMFAAVVALLNDRLLSSGKRPLDVLNPLLCSKGLPLNDIVSGGSSLGCGARGLFAAAGWDPVTGLGTPDFQKLLAVVTRERHDRREVPDDGDCSVLSRANADRRHTGFRFGKSLSLREFSEAGL